MPDGNATLTAVGESFTVRAPVYKISQGVSGRMPCGFQVHLDTYSGDHTGIYVAPSGGKMVRCGTRPPDALNAGLIRNLDSAKANGVDMLFGLSTSTTPALPVADFPAWEKYLRNNIAYVKARWPWVNKWEWKNEPAFDGPTCASALARDYPIIKSADPNGLVFAPSQHLLGFTPGRKYWVPEFIAAGGLRYLDVFTWHVYGCYGPPEAAYAWDMRWVMAQVLKAAPNMKFAISEFGWRDNLPVEVGGPGHEYASPADRQNYIARAFLIHRSLPNMMASLMYMANDSAGTGFGLYDALRQPKPAQRYAKDTLDHINTWNECAAYSRGIECPSMDAQMAFADPAHRSPWYVRGTLDSGSQELALWHPEEADPSKYPAAALPAPSHTPMRDTITVEASADCTLAVQAIGTGTTEIAFARGRRELPVVLTQQPQVLHTRTPDVRLTFPEFNS